MQPPPEPATGESGKSAKAHLYLTVTVKTVVLIFILFIPFKDSIYEISNGLIGIIFLLLIIQKKEIVFFINNKRTVLIFLLLFISMTMSNFMGQADFYGWEKQAQFFYRYVLLYFALLYFLQKNFISISFIFYAAFLSLGIQAINGIYQYFAGIDLLKHRLIFGGHRLTAAVHNPNLFGFLMMIGALSIIGTIHPSRLIKTGTWKFLALCLLLCMFFFCLLYSGSRAAWLSLACGIFLFFLLRFRNWNRTMKFFAIALLLALPVLLLPNDFFMNRMGSAFISYGQRPECWQGAAAFIPDAPVFGHGIRDDMVFHRIKGRPVTWPHNAYLEAMVYLGVVGFLVYCGLGWAICRRALKFVATQPVYCLLLAGILVSAFFAHSFISDQILLSVCCLLCACLWFHENHNPIPG